jgi:glyoxylase-like metal-dependent hydrolase (beta-lactamase superfamily II)
LSADFSGGLPLFADAEKIYVGPADDRALRKQLRDVSGDPLAKCESVRTEMRFDFGDETVVLIPVGSSATESDLAVFFEKRSILFMGALFYNQIHPILRVGKGLQPQVWIRNFSMLMERFKPKTVIPAEGDLASFEDAQKFLNYLKDLTDSSVEFSQCRAKYDWPEIPSYTSLEENFDLLRDQIKSHTTL